MRRGLLLKRGVLPQLLCLPGVHRKTRRHLPASTARTRDEVSLGLHTADGLARAYIYVIRAKRFTVHSSGCVVNGSNAVHFVHFVLLEHVY